jgi:pyruvate dehydrogenase E2 component (dihydrolipoamide acetyltransferase)
MVSIAFRNHPYINASLKSDKIIVHANHDIAVAVGTENGLVAPIVRNCQSKSILQIDNELKDLIARAKEGRLLIEEYEDSTFTISNLGMYDIENFTAIINPPGAAILAIGKITEEAVVVDREINIKPKMNLILSCDHRLIDGTVGAAFLKEIKDILELPMLGYF